MALELMADGTLINVTPDNWNDLAFQERQLEEKKLGRKLTPAESISIIENYRNKGMGTAPIDDSRRISQAADSVEATLELPSVDYVDVTAGAVKALQSAGEIVGQTASLITFAGVGIGAFLLWKLFK